MNAGMTTAGRKPADHAARREALDVTRSYIVQAPAGSGKTGLLTQRYLALLATVEYPEEIVAITFTRKAAAEMRQRILDALLAARGPEPEKDYERQTWVLARAALEQDTKRGWAVRDNPQRLRIRTIDSLCQFIGRQLPVRSGFGDVPGVVEDAAFLYSAAAEATVNELESATPIAEHLSTLLGVLDNQVDKLAGLIAAMLARRDQWIEHILNHGSRSDTEAILVRVIEQYLAELAVAFEGLGGRLLPLLRFAAGNLPDDHALASMRDRRALPGADAGDLSDWQQLSGFLLTNNGTWRKAVDKNLGFPADKKAPFMQMKAEMQSLLEDLREDEALGEMLAGLSHLPNPRYSDQEWAAVEALFEVLRHAFGLLKVVFAEQGQVDFIELSLRAIDALGSDLEPTELALQLDYRLRHLLVDEFQDTSVSQHALFRRLTDGWERGDGRTLFLVGDPMQSIYRFREAEVGLFLEAWQGNLGGVQLAPLQLTVNFRSDQGIIDWVNAVFPSVMPDEDDPMRGAVRYAASVAHHDPGLPEAVTVHPFLGKDDEAEAVTILKLIREARERGGKTAILARSKAHLAELVQQLRDSDLRYQAVEIGALQHSPAVMDLVSLARALIHLGDRVAWLSLLHGPFVGLSLADMLALTGEQRDEHEAAIVDRLFDPRRLEGLSEDGRERLQRVLPVLETVLSERGRRPLHEWVEAAWLGLGGPLTLADPAAEEDSEVFFQLLQRLGSDGRHVTPERLDEEVARLTAMPDPLASDSLQLMSIHKAKGLEFDTVILPGLGKGTRSDDPQLLYWLQAAGEHGEAELFFGPVKMAHESEHSSTTNYIKQLDKEKDAYESGRLLYVAATRAKRELHLLGHVNEKKNGERSPVKGSLLNLLWPSIGHFWDELEQAEEPEDGAPVFGPVDIHRSAVPAGWQLPEPPPGIRTRLPEAEAKGEEIPYEWAGEMARAVGTVVHRLLQHSAERGVRVNTSSFYSDPKFEHLLREAGVTRDETDEALRRVSLALERITADERGQWILSGEHAESACELPLTAFIDGQVRHLIIDRTFVDDSGTRWVIDYKTGTHSGGGLAHFLDEEEARYREQLQRYVTAFRILEDRPVRAALYFPLIEGGWRELDIN